MGQQMLWRRFLLLQPRLKFRHCLLEQRFKNGSWSAATVRQTYLDFFMKQHGHQYVQSSSVLPCKGQGTYFINAGMNQFKPEFLGGKIRHSRVCNSQKCIRVGGKHNDLDDVGNDLYHHTFFEMLGNWSFADYFKIEACRMAWQLLTDVYKIPSDKLYVTYFAGSKRLGLKADDETKEIWQSLGLDGSRILPFGEKDNFWDMGTSGPCGPCTEIHYDNVGKRNAGHLVNTGDPEVKEIWNLVFIQYDRGLNQELTKLPNCHVDTGMGLERLVAILQGHQSNYDTDLFTPIFNEIERRCDCPPYEGKTGVRSTIDRAYRVVADHVRMASITITDGLLPGNSNLEHKLKLVLDRCIYQAYKVLKAPPGVVGSLVPIVVETLGEQFPELNNRPSKVVDVINNYEERYLSYLSDAEKVFTKSLMKLQVVNSLSGDDIDQIYEGKFGQRLPVNLIQLLAEDLSINLDLQAFYKKQKETTTSQPKLPAANTTCLLSSVLVKQLQSDGIEKTIDSHKYSVGYCHNGYSFKSLTSEVVALIYDGKLVSKVDDGVKCGVIVKETPFYAESGGQVADVGIINACGNTANEIKVDTVQSCLEYVVHVGTVTGSVHLHDRVELSIDQHHREGCMRSHTATHLLNSALRQVLQNIHQRGSLVTENRLTFDFACEKSLEPEDIRKVIQIASRMIYDALPVTRRSEKYEDIKNSHHLITLQDEVYPEMVYVVSVGDDVKISVELCAGTHVGNTTDIGQVAVVNVSGVSQGTKRIVAITGAEAIQAIEKVEEIRNDYLSLFEDIERLQKQETWHKRLKNLDRAMSELVLPKLERDELISNVDQIRHKVMTYVNHQIKLSKVQTMKDAFRKHDSGIVMEFPFHNSREAMQLVAMSQIQKPMMFLRKEEHHVKGFVFVPPTMENVLNVDEWTDAVCSYLKDSRFYRPSAKVKGIGTNSVRQFSCKNWKDIEIVIEIGKQYLNSAIENR